MSKETEGKPPNGASAYFACETIEWSEDRLVLAFDAGLQHLNSGGTVHGGVLMTLLDIACGRVGLWSDNEASRPRCVTIQLTASFVGAPSPGPLTITAHLLGGGKTVFMASAEITDEQGQLCAAGQGAFRRVPSRAAAETSS